MQRSALKWTYFLILVYANILHDHLCDSGLPTFETCGFLSCVRVIFLVSVLLGFNKKKKIVAMTFGKPLILVS